MKYKKMISGIALILMAIVPVYAQQYDSEKDFQIDWDSNVKNGVVITKYIGTRKEVRIPPNIQNNQVTGISDNAFADSSITSVIIPNSVTRIGYTAFANCTKLTSVIISNSVTLIEEKVFFGCESLTNITIPDSVTYIDEYAFASCTSLTSVIIGNSVKTISERAFVNCTKLTNVIIPNSVSFIDEAAFANCTNLISVTFRGNIFENNLKYNSFPDDLRDKYLAGGIGTYMKARGGSTWSKQ
jgi:hypothetical protein